jgi:hypothetical protein
VFRSTRRDVVFPQSEHARLAATIALAWGNEAFPRPPVPFESFVRGVTLHDRGYEPFDADGIGEVPSERWLEIQRESFRPRGKDAVVDLVVAMHITRLVGHSSRSADAAAELGGQLAGLRAAAGLDEAAALATDRVTDLCDRIAFDFCFEEPASGGVDIPTGGAEAARVSYHVDGRGLVTLDPWPLAVPRLCGILFAYRSEGYPDRLDPCVVPFEAVPA